MDIGRAIKLFRTQKGLTQTELAERTTLSVSYLSLLERNKRDPVMSSIIKIADALDISVFILMFTASSNTDKQLLGSGVCEKISHLILSIQEDKT